MNNQNQNPQDEQLTNPSARNEHGFMTKAKAVFAGSVLVGGAALGLSHNQSNDTQAPTNEVVPAAQAVVPGTVLEAKPVALPEPAPVETVKPTSAEPVATEAPAPVVEHQNKPTHHEAPAPATPNTSAPEMMPDDSGMLASNGTPSPTEAPTSPAPEIMPDDSGMLPPTTPSAQQ